MEWGVLVRGNWTSNALTAQYLSLTPYIASFQQTLDRLGWVASSVTAGSVKMGLYMDNGDTPVGGALIVGSAAVAALANQKNELTIVDSQIDPGLYWLAQLAQTGINASKYYIDEPGHLGGTLCSYGDGIGSDDLPAICPDVTENQTKIMYARIASVP